MKPKASRTYTLCLGKMRIWGLLVFTCTASISLYIFIYINVLHIKDKTTVSQQEYQMIFMWRRVKGKANLGDGTMERFFGGGGNGKIL